MKKLIIKIGNKIHELPYNGETFSFEVEEKYVPKVGDCVMIRPKDSNILYWCKRFRALRSLGISSTKAK